MLLLLIIRIKSGIPTSFGWLLRHINEMGIQGEVKRLIWAVRRSVEFGLAALEGTVSDGLHPNLTPKNYTSLHAREDISLLVIMENESVNGVVSPPSHSSPASFRLISVQNSPVVEQGILINQKDSMLKKEQMGYAEG